MSWVSGITLICSCAEDSPDSLDRPYLMDRIDAWLDEHHEGYSDGQSHLQPFDMEKSGGTKHPQIFVCVAGLNHFEKFHEDFAAFVLSLPWKYPEDLVLVINPEQGHAEVHRPTEKRREK